MLYTDAVKDCPASWTKGLNDKCYKLIDSPVDNWNRAQSVCQNEGSNLAIIKNEEDNKYIADFGDTKF